MARYLKIALTKRNLEWRARLLDEEAPRTCAAVWEVLPLRGPARHAKYARNELYTLCEAFPEEPLGLENPTVTPIPGDLCYFDFDRARLSPGSHGYGEGEGPGDAERMVDLALFYGRNNLLLNGDVGWVPGNVFASIEEGRQELADACNDIWRAGAMGEFLEFSRIEG